MVLVKEALLKEFAILREDASEDRFSDNLTNSVGHITINGRVYEVQLSLEGDVNEMIVGPLDKDVVKLEA